MSETKLVRLEREAQRAPIFWFRRAEIARILGDRRDLAIALRKLSRLGVCVVYRKPLTREDKGHRAMR